MNCQGLGVRNRTIKYKNRGKCIGIVITGGDDSNDEDNTDWLNKGETIQGYVLALTETKTTWCNQSTIPNAKDSIGTGGSYPGNNTNFGYERTKKILDIITKYNATLSGTDTVITVAHTARTFEPKAPESTSGWYVPSETKLKTYLTYIVGGKYVSVLTNDRDNKEKQFKLSDRLINAGGESIGTNCHWTNTLYTPSQARTITRSSATANNVTAKNISVTDTKSYLRPVLTFTKPRKKKINQNE